MNFPEEEKVTMTGIMLKSSDGVRLFVVHFMLKVKIHIKFKCNT